MRFLRGAFYTWDDLNYANFIIDFLKILEPRHIAPKETISDELYEVNEIFFLQHGNVNVGYEVNRQERFRIRLEAATSVIGAFEMLFRRRQLFIYRTHTECRGYSIRFNNWKELEDDYSDFAKILKRKILTTYI